MELNENQYDNEAIFYEIKKMCGKGNYHEASLLMNTKFKLKDVETIFEIKQYYYYIGLTHLFGRCDATIAQVFFKLALFSEKSNELDYIDILSINGIGVSYAVVHKNKEAKIYLDQSYIELTKVTAKENITNQTIELIKIYYNNAKYYSQIGDCKKAIDLCQEGIDYLKKMNQMYFLEFLLYEKAYNLFLSKKIKLAAEAYFYAAAFSKFNDNEHGYMQIKKDFKTYDLQIYRYW